uniref:Uncharacterized protein n=1 Tax=Globisporangium ultimum (strain ATCC 200006 / CBS 805.95 / DAOM BR144) TaxID=431595 RepID=K3X353_GLOUD
MYGENCIQRNKDVECYDKPKLGDSRILSPSDWVKSKMHVIGDTIDYKHIDDVTADFGTDGYTYLLQYQFNELDESQILGNFFFKSSEDRESFELANIDCGVEYCIETKSYDERLYRLCMMIRSDWYHNTQNLWNLAGFFARQPHSDWYLMRKTYLCVLKQKLERFDKAYATKEFDGWFDSKYHPSLNEGRLKGITAGFDSVAYKQWKNDYEVKEMRIKSSQPSTLDQDFELTFKSERKLATLTQLVELTGRTIDDMRSAMVDTSFEIDELEYWAEKYLVIENKPNRDFELNFSTFAKMLKTTNFESLHLLKQFVLYFIHEFYVFEGSDITYYK